MSRVNCNIAGDLIPLYVDDVLSPDSVEMLEEHLAVCGHCAAKVETLRRDTVIAPENTAEPLQKIKRRITHERWFTAGIVSAVIVGICFWTGVFLWGTFSEFRLSYADAKNHLIVVTGSDLTDGAKGREEDNALILYRGRPDLHANVIYEIVGEKNGVKQAEVTLYLARRWNDTSVYWDTVWQITQNGIDWNHLGQPYLLAEQIGQTAAQIRQLKGCYRIFEVHSPVCAAEQEDAYENASGFAGSSGLTYFFDESVPTEAVEVVAVYYGQFEAGSRYAAASHVRYIGGRYVLWAKEGYTAHP